MKSYDLKVGYACNNKCVHCVIEDSKDKLVQNKLTYDLSTNEILSLIDSAINDKCDNIVLTGGEVTIRKDFSELVQYCLSNNLFITIQTNGRRLFIESVQNTVKDIANIRFVVALHGSKDYTHDSITQIKGSFDETCKGIKTMTSLGKTVILKVVISNINMMELPDIVVLAKKLGVKYICFAFPHGQGAARKNFDAVIPRYYKLQPILEEMIEKANKKEIRIEFETIPFCIIPKHMKLVGELRYLLGQSFCTQVKEDTFDWDVVRNEIKTKTNKCRKCSFFKLCEGPWSEYVDKYGDDEFKPIIIADNVLHNLNIAIDRFTQKSSR